MTVKHGHLPFFWSCGVVSAARDEEAKRTRAKRRATKIKALEFIFLSVAYDQTRLKLMENVSSFVSLFIGEGNEVARGMG